MMDGSIELARLICVEIAGEPVPGDTDGDSYGSMEIAEILSAGYEKLQSENELLKKRYESSEIERIAEKKRADFLSNQLDLEREETDKLKDELRALLAEKAILLINKPKEKTHE